MDQIRKLAGVLSILLVSLGFLAAEPPSDVDDINRGEAPERKIVVFQPGTGEASQRSVIEGAGGRFGKPLRLINAATARFPNETAAQAAASAAGVLRVESDFIANAALAPGSVAQQGGQGNKGGGVSQPVQETSWGVSRVKAPEAWSVTQGAGVNVCVLDTGVDLTHADLAENVKSGYNAINPSRTAKDDNGHGTHVAGIIAAVNNTIGVVGVGPKISVIPVKVLGASGSGWISDIIEGLEWCGVNGGKVANMSLGSSSDSQSLHDAITALYNAGLVLVAAAGNSGPCANCVSYPARYSEVIAVSASDSSDQFASYSSQGPEVDLIAPGSNVLSTWKGGGYATASGTSMATPHVSAVAALKRAQNPSLGPADVASALKSGADALPGLISDQQGSGLVNAQKTTALP
ncbi:MAG: S8 family peptidase [Elusimicrobia bacterium]|nr:S8 family peptidase [Elusimicrobiota bacterium]